MYVLLNVDEEEKHIKTIWIEHDNGIQGQHGFSEEKISSEAEINDLIKSYENCRITVYGWYY